MTDELCARPGCGAPKSWHDQSSTVAELARWDDRPPSHDPVIPLLYGSPLGSCVGGGCTCTAYLAPEPPKPERKAYVVEMATDEHLPLLRTKRGAPALAVPLDEYLAAHPQPLAFPANTKCAVRGCDYYTATVLCTHCAASLGKFTKQQLMDGPQS